MLGASNCPTSRLRPACPGKRVAFNDSRTAAKQPLAFLFPPKDSALPRTRTGLLLAPIKVRRRTGSLAKSNSVKDMDLRRPETPTFPKNGEGCRTSRRQEECSSLFQSESTSAEVSFGS